MKRLFFILAMALIIGCSPQPLIQDSMEIDHAGHMNAKPITTAALKAETLPIIEGAEAKLLFQMEDAQGQPISDLLTEHARKVHVVVIGEDLDTFGHVHTEDFFEITKAMEREGTYPVLFTFPKAGTYLVALDTANPAGEFSKAFSLSVEGDTLLKAPSFDFSTKKNVVGIPEEKPHVMKQAVQVSKLEQNSSERYEVTFSAPKEISPNKEAILEFYFSKAGKGVTNLEPYLEAPMHFALVSTDLTFFTHTHGGPPEWMQHVREQGHMAHADQEHAKDDLPSSFGPIIQLAVTFPQPGVYKIFGQARHNGKLLIVPFMTNITGVKP